MAITGIILAGGKSSRMGFDKGLAEVEGKTSIQRVADVLAKVCDNTILSCNNDSYVSLGLPTYKDIYTDKGPMAGIHSGLEHSDTEHNLLVACDLPFVSVGFLNHILGESADTEVTVPVYQGELQPLCGYYNRSIVERIGINIREGKLKTQEAIHDFKLKELEITGDEPFFHQQLFTNINSQKDLEQWQ